jgi:hypothetical protein
MNRERWTCFMGSMVTGLNVVGLLFMRTHQTNIYKTRTEDLNGLKTPITQEIELIKKKLYTTFFLI